MIAADTMVVPVGLFAVGILACLRFAIGRDVSGPGRVVAVVAAFVLGGILAAIYASLNAAGYH